MRDPEPDPLDLWRGIDDAIWREATRALAERPRTEAPLAADSRRVAKARRDVTGPAKVAERV